MMARVKAASLHELPPGASLVVRVNGESIALFNGGGEIVALGNVCPHAGESLGEGTVEGDIVICPGHGWEYDLRSGACMTVPGESVPRFPVTVEGDAILVDLGE
ncbi:MAG: Rieske (2Fe-2S) protein [Candidatus Rokubacteria bacterium]|nr:Rieske (2Fe-2S) protein [Candidatus Rokubacteria bacterium]